MPTWSSLEGWLCEVSSSSVKVFKCSRWLSNFILLVVAVWFPCTTGTTFHLILPHIVSNEQHNSMWPSVRKYVVWKMLLTIKGCTFQFTLNHFIYIYSLPLPPFRFLPHTRNWRQSLARQGSQHLILTHHIKLYNGLGWTCHFFQS